MAQFLRSVGFGTLLPSLDVPAQIRALLQFLWSEERLIQRAACWDELVQLRRLGGAGWLALWPQSSAQSVWLVTGFSQVTHLCPCHYPAVASCRNLRFSTPASWENPVPLFASWFLSPELLHSLLRSKCSPASDFSCLVALIKCAWSLT